jgi:SAM-dependent methyltransferase
MLTPKEILGHIAGGRVLDVATGNGSFIYFLMDGLKDYDEIIGLDTNERGVGAFAETFKDKPNIRFDLRDALHPGYDAASFDTVCISNSLHHFDDPVAVLSQMMRLLRPGGHLILAEMYQDGQVETQITHVNLHHWWAAIDRENGVVHHETYRREEIVAMVNALGLSELGLYDQFDLGEDPKNPEILAELNPIFDRYIQRAEGRPDLQKRGEDLRKRVAEVGFHSATTLFAVGKKPANPVSPGE